jgi:hypothetical protein
MMIMMGASIGEMTEERKWETNENFYTKICEARFKDILTSWQDSCSMVRY